MRILVCGASGFVGRHLAKALHEAGHTVVRGVRRPTEKNDIAIDYRTDIDKSAWLPRLAGVDVVVNAIGVLRDSAKQPMEQLHGQAPCALFSACAEAGVKRVVHVSALGVEGDLQTAYYRTKRQAEACLFKLPEEVRWLNLRPSLIYGEDGASARLFRKLASLPVHVHPMGGTQLVQPVHIDDIAKAVCQWLVEPAAISQSVFAVGAETATLRGMLESYRAQMGFRPAHAFSMPRVLIKLTARIGDFIPATPLCSDTLAMLESGNTADAEGFRRLLRREPRSYRRFMGDGSP